MAKIDRVAEKVLRRVALVAAMLASFSFCVLVSSTDDSRSVVDAERLLVIGGAFCTFVLGVLLGALLVIFTFKEMDDVQ